MKKSKIVGLVMLSSALAAFQQPASKSGGASGSWDADTSGQSGRKVYMRSDTTAPYTRTITHHSSGLPLFLVFRSLSMFNPNTGYYTHGGYYSHGIGEHSNVGRNVAKGGIVRGGFGRSGRGAS